MNTFNTKNADGTERTWMLEVDLPTRKAVLAATGNKVDLFDAFDGKLYQQLADVETRINVLWVMCKDQAGTEVTEIAFAKSIKGDIVEQSGEALWQAIVDFFPTRQRQILTTAEAKRAELRGQAQTKILQAIDSVTLDELLKNNSSNSPDASASIPAGSASVS